MSNRLIRNYGPHDKEELSKCFSVESLVRTIEYIDGDLELIKAHRQVAVDELRVAQTAQVKYVLQFEYLKEKLMGTPQNKYLIDVFGIPDISPENLFWEKHEVLYVNQMDAPDQEREVALSGLIEIAKEYKTSEVIVYSTRLFKRDLKMLEDAGLVIIGNKPLRC